MTDGWEAGLLLSGVALVGSCVQWLTGMGFALVAGPALVLLLALGGGLTTLGKSFWGL